MDNEVFVPVIVSVLTTLVAGMGLGFAWLFTKYLPKRTEQKGEKQLHDLQRLATSLGDTSNRENTSLDAVLAMLKLLVAHLISNNDGKMTAVEQSMGTMSGQISEEMKVTRRRIEEIIDALNELNKLLPHEPGQMETIIMSPTARDKAAKDKDVKTMRVTEQVINDG